MNIRTTCGVNFRLDTLANIGCQVSLGRVKVPTMPSRRRKYTVNQWHARVKRYDIEYHLGYFPTREEALAVEQEFAKQYPPDPRGRRKVNQ